MFGLGQKQAQETTGFVVGNVYRHNSVVVVVADVNHPDVQTAIWRCGVGNTRTHMWCWTWAGDEWIPCWTNMEYAAFYGRGLAAMNEAWYAGNS